MHFFNISVNILLLRFSTHNIDINMKYRLYLSIRGGAKMAKCDICGKGVHFGNNVSHSHRRTNAIWNSNVKSVKCKVNGAAKRMHVCTSCLKSGKVERA